MRLRLVLFLAAAAAMLVAAFPLAQMKPWNNPGLSGPPSGPAGPAPRRDLSGTWDAGNAGIQPTGHVAAPFTPQGAEMAKANHPGNGTRLVSVNDDNDPLSTVGDPTGFPRIILYELRPFQIVQTPNQVLILYMFEKRWRVVWTDGRALPKDPDPRWYGYSVGHWEDDYTFVVNTVGTDERTWLDNSGNPHSGDLKVEERYHRVSRDLMELTVTLDDPKAYTRPWTPRNRMPLTLAPASFDMMEMICSPSEVMDFRKNINDRTNNK